MTVAITKSVKFAHLNDRGLLRTVGGTGLEKEAVVDIVVATEDLSDSVVGNFVCDFTAVGFKQVYDCIISKQSDLTDLFFFNEGALSAAATASIDVKQIADGSAQNSASYTVTLRATIRGV